MKARSADPRRLDVEAFAKEAGVLEGDWPLAALERLADAAHPDAKPKASDMARWRAAGERRAVRGALAQTWLHLEANACMSLVCQRCLAPVDSLIETKRSFLFVAGEDAAAELDADSEDDVLALTRSLDLRDLVEDELLLALPLVPRHERCPAPLELVQQEPVAEERANPFAALAGLKRQGPPS